MKLPPASVKTSKIRLASALEAPQPSDASSPNVIAPRQTSDTRSPLGPRSAYLMSVGLDVKWPPRDARPEGKAVDARPPRPLRVPRRRQPRQTGAGQNRRIRP